MSLYGEESGNVGRELQELDVGNCRGGVNGERERERVAKGVEAFCCVWGKSLMDRGRGKL